jgi:hypothetical protein
MSATGRISIIVVSVFLHVAFGVEAGTRLRRPSSTQVDAVRLWPGLVVSWPAQEAWSAQYLADQEAWVLSRKNGRQSIWILRRDPGGLASQPGVERMWREGQAPGVTSHCWRRVEVRGGVFACEGVVSKGSSQRLEWWGKEHLVVLTAQGGADLLQTVELNRESERGTESTSRSPARELKR